eukprot:gene1447-biopygen21327
MPGGLHKGPWPPGADKGTIASDCGALQSRRRTLEDGSRAAPCAWTNTWHSASARSSASTTSTLSSRRTTNGTGPASSNAARTSVRNTPTSELWSTTARAWPSCSTSTARGHRERAGIESARASPPARESLKHARWLTNFRRHPGGLAPQGNLASWRLGSTCRSLNYAALPPMLFTWQSEKASYKKYRLFKTSALANTTL